MKHSPAFVKKNVPGNDNYDSKMPDRDYFNVGTCLRAIFAGWLNASRRSRVVVGLNSSVGI